MKFKVFIICVLILPNCWLSDGLTCHICVGNQATSCATDPKNIQTLACTYDEATTTLHKLLKLLDIEVPVDNNFSCMSVRYQMGHKKQELFRKRTIRSCLKTKENFCPKIVKALNKKPNIKSTNCFQCSTDYCNSKDNHVQMKYFVLYTSTTFLTFNNLFYF